MLVKTRLQINVAVSVLTAFVIVLVLFLALCGVNRAVQEANIAREITACAFDKNTLRDDYLRTDSERAKKQWLAKDEEMGRLLKSASEKFKAAEDKKNIEELNSDHVIGRKIFTAIVEKREKTRWDADSATLSQEAESRLASQMRMREYDKAINVRTLDEEAGRRLFSALRLAGWAIICVISVAAAAAILNSWTMGRIVADRIGRLRDGASVIGGGNLDHRIDTEGEDEFAELSRAINAMTVKLQSSYLKLEKEIAERQSAEEGLRQSEDRFRTMADAMPQLAWIARADGFVYWYNRQWYEYTGMTPEQLEGWGWQSVHDPQVLPTVLDQWKGSIATGQPFEMIFPLKGEDGAFRPFLTRGLPLRDPQGRVVQWLGTSTDVTEIKRAEDALQKLNEELEIRVAQRTEELDKALAEREARNAELQEAYHGLKVETAERFRILEELRQREQLLIQQSRMAAMGEMLGYIAHQWRQPLNVLGLNVQELGLSYKHGSFSEELLDDNISTAMEIIKHLSRTIDDFRDFLTSDKEKKSFKVDQVIAKTVGLIEGHFKKENISIDISSTGDPQINGYPNEYSQVLLNLLTNARDAFLENGLTDARVTVRSWTENGLAVVTITDNAGGIKEEIIEKIFDAYFTTKELGKGTGVGLFMSKMIIEKNMGGRLSVRNVEGGAQFKIEV